MRKGFVLLALISIPLIVSAVFLEQLNRTPRDLARQIERNVQGRRALLVDLGTLAAKTLRSLDRSDAIIYPLPSLAIGVQQGKLASTYSGRLVEIHSSKQAVAAINNARAGDIITFLPGTYTFVGNSIAAIHSGLEHAPIVVRAEQVGTVILKLETVEGFHVQAAYWVFENLVLQGTCPVQAYCEHAFHIVGNAHHFVARNNKIMDFNSHIKVNMENGFAPDDGVFEHNTLNNTEVRRTDSSVTLFDLVGASRWRIHQNQVSDFIKEYSDQISYGMFVKGGGADNQITHNLIICEHRLRDMQGQRVGISLGGGGTGQQYCRDHRCITEQDRGVVASNLVMACSDDGIYLNKAASSIISHNTLLQTGGIEVRFPESSADVNSNLVDGKIRARDDGLLRMHGNVDRNMLSQYLGWHSLQNLFQDSLAMDLRWRKKPDAVSSISPDMLDLCGASRTETPLPGAFDDFTLCLLTVEARHK